VAYKEYQIRWSVARFARMLRDRVSPRCRSSMTSHFSIVRRSILRGWNSDPDIDWVGMNMYRRPAEHSAIADRARFLSGSTRLPFVPEFGAGLWSHHFLTPTPAEQEFVDLCALMYGIKAFSFYMLVERDRWQASPITRHGDNRPDYAPFYCELLSFLTRFEFSRFVRRPRVLVLLNYDLVASRRRTRR